MGKVVGGGPRLNHLTFADDVVTIAESVVGLQHLCGLGGGRGRPPPRPISTMHVACAGLFYPPSGVNLNMRG